MFWKKVLAWLLDKTEISAGISAGVLNVQIWFHGYQLVDLHWDVNELIRMPIASVVRKAVSRGDR